MIQADKTLNGLVAERVISKKSVQALLMDYMKKKAPIKGLLFYAIQELDAPISLSLDGDDAYVIDSITNLHLRNVAHTHSNARRIHQI